MSVHMCIAFCANHHIVHQHIIHIKSKNKKNGKLKKKIDSTTESMIVNSYVNSRISLQDKKLQVVKVNPEEEAHM